MGLSLGRSPRPLTEMEEKELYDNVQQIIHDNRIVVFSKTYCPFARKAKQTLDKVAAGDYAVIELDGHPQGPEIQKLLGQITGASTVPRVFIDGNCIGGGDETAKLYSQGKLQQLINKS